MKNLSSKKGFTLVEAICVVAIIVILSSIMITGISDHLKRAHNAADLVKNNHNATLNVTTEIDNVHRGNDTISDNLTGSSSGGSGGAGGAGGSGGAGNAGGAGNVGGTGGAGNVGGTGVVGGVEGTDGTAGTGASGATNGEKTDLQPSEPEKQDEILPEEKSPENEPNQRDGSAIIVEMNNLFENELGTGGAYKNDGMGGTASIGKLIVSNKPAELNNRLRNQGIDDVQIFIDNNTNSYATNILADSGINANKSYTKIVSVTTDGTVLADHKANDTINVRQYLYYQNGSKIILYGYRDVSATIASTSGNGNIRFDRTDTDGSSWTKTE
ncbi:MAG: prepilin-type N-terminal cleavage/methylation domain-containing protein [Saccharofermentans sp.]|nr:prepilin-type N-terminal cleavage/methylation domain-containing protein [Saccharofermentans sp.]